MARRPLYSKSSRPRDGNPGWVAPDAVTAIYVEAAEVRRPPLRKRLAERWGLFYRRRPAAVLVATSAGLALVFIGAYALLRPPTPSLTQAELNAAVNFAIDRRPPAPAVTTVAYAKIIPSVVRIDGYDPIRPNSSGSPEDRADKTEPKAPLNTNSALPGYENTAAGTGVVISDDGTILTALHVATAAQKLRVIFADGTEGNATIAGAEPENDMAILRPDRIPDDLQPATLASTQGLNPGDQVEAVGFPFGIGPSASAGIVSGLKREFEAEGKSKLTNLIQFDAAANPGNSGGPLVDADGEVVGIVDAILNPSGADTFAGIGFAVPIENATKGLIGDSPL